MDKQLNKFIVVVFVSGIVYAIIMRNIENLFKDLFVVSLLILYVLGVYIGKIVFGGYNIHLKMPDSGSSALCGEHKAELTDKIEDVDCEICLKNEIIRLQRGKT